MKGSGTYSRADVYSCGLLYCEFVMGVVEVVVGVVISVVDVVEVVIGVAVSPGAAQHC